MIRTSESQTTSAIVQAAKTRWLEHLLPIFVALCVTMLDQVMKRWVETNMSLGSSLYPVKALEPYFGLTHSQNTGAAFSLFSNSGPFLVIFALVVMGIILLYAPRLPAGSWVMRVALGLQLGGALGNLIDRLRQGYVTDMLHVQIPELGFNWPVSNLADVFIVFGVVLLIVASLQSTPRSRL